MDKLNEEKILDRADFLYREMKRVQGLPVPAGIRSDQIKALLMAVVEAINDAQHVDLSYLNPYA